MHRSIVVLATSVLLLLSAAAHSGDREDALAIECAGLSGGNAYAFAGCFGGRLADQEIDNFFKGEAFGCNHEIRKLFRKSDSSCNNSVDKPPELQFLMPYKDGYIAGYDNTRLYYSPDGENLKGGGSTENVYSAGQAVLKIVPYGEGVITAFSNGRMYRSPDGRNLGGGGDTELLYTGQSVTELTGKNGGIETCFSGGGCYFSKDGKNPGGGPGTSRTN